jgi:hypothetical protein
MVFGPGVVKFDARWGQKFIFVSALERETVFTHQNFYKRCGFTTLMSKKYFSLLLTKSLSTV